MNTYNYDEIVPQLGYFICRYCTPNWIISDSIIDFIDLTYIFEGSVTYTINGIPYEAGKGDLICIPKNSLRHAEIDPDNPMASYTANFQLYNLKGEDVLLPFPIVSKIDIRKDLMSLYQQMNIEWLEKGFGYVIKVRSIFLSILHCYFKILYYKESLESMDQRINKAIRYIYENYKTQINVDRLAGLVGLNPSYFGTLFKKSTGFAVKEYINNIRVSNAENLLASGEFSVKEAALRCGFEDNFYFSKVFKNIKGYPPSKVAIHTYLK
jgi:AraC-like DNA-binding protein